jgi:hypothetical protein
MLAWQLIHLVMHVLIAIVIVKVAVFMKVVAAQTLLGILF